MLQFEDLQTPQNFAIAMCLVLLTALYLKHKPYYPPSKTPSTPGLPFLGSLLMLDQNWQTLPDVCTKFNNEFKRTYCFPVANIGLLGSAVFSVFSEESIQHVLKVS